MPVISKANECHLRAECTINIDRTESTGSLTYKRRRADVTALAIPLSRQSTFSVGARQLGASGFLAFRPTVERSLDFECICIGSEARGAASETSARSGADI